jgi:phosphatidylserine decarboxylase
MAPGRYGRNCSRCSWTVQNINNFSIGDFMAITLRLPKNRADFFKQAKKVLSG